MRLPFGTGYIRVKDIRSPPPQRFAPGDRVDTPYGKGVVRELRANEARIDYVVDLIENTLSGAAVVTTPTASLVRVDSMYEAATAASRRSTGNTGPWPPRKRLMFLSSVLSQSLN